MRDSEEDLARLRNEKKPVTEKERLIQQVPFRLHRNDYKVLKKMLADDNWKFQTLIQACIDNYINRNPLMVKLLCDWKEENTLPRRIGDKYTLSGREKRELLDTLENEDSE